MNEGWFTIMDKKFRLIVKTNGNYRFVLLFDDASDLELGRNVIQRSFIEENTELKPQMSLQGKWIDFELPN